MLFDYFHNKRNTLA